MGIRERRKLILLKHIHSLVSKYITAELQKCNFQEKIFDDTYNCSDRFKDDRYANAIAPSLATHWGAGTSNSKFKHPEGTYSAVSHGTIRGPCKKMWEFSSKISNTTTKVKVETCPTDKEEDRLTTIIPIE